MIDPNELQKSSEIVQMSKTGAFSDLVGQVTMWMTEAYDHMVEAELASDALLASLTRRYQQRLKLKRELDRFVESAQKAVDENIETMRQELERMEAEGALNR